jgi:8-oxo-dGTP pyrophosphatase MutT (NUDIX family)
VRISSFVFVPVKKSDLPGIVKNGLDPATKSFNTLEKARANGGRVLLVSRKAIQEGRVRPKNIANLRPYRRAVAIAAGGGVLLRLNKASLEIVLIYRRGKWDIAKGKRERRESNRVCAIREVEEELGIDDASIISKLGKTVHAYRAKKRRYLVKTTHWYSMQTDAQAFVPQLKEHITDARWVSLKEAEEMLGYKILRQLLEVSREQLLTDSLSLS